MRMSFIAAAVAAAFAMAPSASAADCPSDVLATKLKEGEGLTCSCAANINTTSGLYGTDRYTADSGVCLAAVHAGKITAAAGGEVTLYTGPGCGQFKSTTQNGVTSSAWGSYGNTFAFVTPLPDCALQGGATIASAPPATSEPVAESPSAPKAGPAPGAGPKEWQARADKFAKALPEPLKDWGSTDPRGEWANDSMNGHYVAGVVWYKKGGNTLNSDVFVQIINAPDGGPFDRGEQLWTDEAYRTESKATKGTFAGRDAVIVDPDGDHSVYFRMESGIFVVLTRLKSHTAVTAEDLEAYAKALDFAKIEKLSPS